MNITATQEKVKSCKKSYLFNIIKEIRVMVLAGAGESILNKLINETLMGYSGRVYEPNILTVPDISRVHDI